MTKESNFFVSSGNVFADLGLPDAEEHLAKAELVTEMIRIMKKRKLTQQKAAKLMGTTQAKISTMVRGGFRKMTLDRLMKMLVALDQDVIISYKPKSRKSDHATITAHPV